MTDGRVRRAVALLAITAAVVAGLAVVRALHLSFNATASMPIGLYRRFPVDRAPVRGDLVEVCAPPGLARFAAQRAYLPKGDCVAQTAPLLKYVAASSGDVVDVTAGAVRVNGSTLPHSATLARDAAGRPLPHAVWRRYRLRAGELWLTTPAVHGWDSRYYGPLPARNAIAFAKPFLTAAP